MEVIFSSACEKMCGIHAQRVVALVADHQSFRNRPVVQLVSHPVSQNLVEWMLFASDLSVAAAIQATDPFLTTIGFLRPHFSVEALLEKTAHA